MTEEQAIGVGETVTQEQAGGVGETLTAVDVEETVIDEQAIGDDYQQLTSEVKTEDRACQTVLGVLMRHSSILWCLIFRPKSSCCLDH